MTTVILQESCKSLQNSFLPTSYQIIYLSTNSLHTSDNVVQVSTNYLSIETIIYETKK
jgi:hypothetical protein